MRALLRVAGLALLFLACLPLHLLSKGILRRSDWPRRFLRAAAWIIGARVRTVGSLVRGRTLLTPNHVSWMDILLLAAATGCRFVSKDELGSRFVHWLADQNHTLYVRRSSRTDSKQQARAIADALAGSQPVALFPEGTTGPGDRLLPFRSTLFEAAASAGHDIEVRPVALDYGPAATEIAWFEEPAKSNVRRILGRKGVLPVTVRLLEPVHRPADRKRMAEDAHAAIATALFTSSSPSAGL